MHDACYGNGLEPTSAMVRYTAFILSSALCTTDFHPTPPPQLPCCMALILLFALCTTSVTRTTITGMQSTVHHNHAPQAEAHNCHGAV